MDEGTKREQRIMDSVWVCMQVCMLCVVVCTGRYAQAGRCYADMFVCRYGMLCSIHKQANMRCVVRCMQIVLKACKMGKNGAKRAENRGIVDILYDGFRKCFVNCKFTFYITLSSYLKKVKIPKTSKNHSKM